MNKFNIGDQVRVVKGMYKESTGTVKSFEGDPDNDIVYSYNVKLDNSEKIYPVPFKEFNLEKVELDPFLQSLKDYEESKEREGSTDEAFFEMAGRLPGEIKVGPKRGILIVAVGSDENRGEAHFHVYRSKKDCQAWKNGACLSFTKNQYFDHGKNRETLTEDELNAVIKTLKEKHKTLNVSNWEYLMTLWNDNDNFPTIEIQKEYKDLYDYKTITRYKEKK